MKAWDRRGLEGMPLKLLIMSLLVSLTLPVVMGSVESYERSTARSMVIKEAERLVSEIEEVMSAGEGNRRIVSISLPAAADRFHLALEAGDAIGGTASMTVRCTRDGIAFITLAPEAPPARITSADGQSLRLQSGEHRISVECVRDEGRTVAVLEALE